MDENYIGSFETHTCVSKKIILDLSMEIKYT